MDNLILYNNSTVHIPIKNALIVVAENIKRYTYGMYKSYIDTGNIEHTFIVKPFTSIIMYTSNGKELKLENKENKNKFACVKRIGIINTIIIKKLS